MFTIPIITALLLFTGILIALINCYIQLKDSNAYMDAIGYFCFLALNKFCPDEAAEFEAEMDTKE